jgi:hypothetical protein
MIILIFKKASVFPVLLGLLIWTIGTLWLCLLVLAADEANWGAKLGALLTGIGQIVSYILVFFMGKDIMDAGNVLLIPIIGALWTLVLAFVAWIINSIFRLIASFF